MAVCCGVTVKILRVRTNLPSSHKRLVLETPPGVSSVRFWNADTESKEEMNGKKKMEKRLSDRLQSKTHPALTALLHDCK